MLIDQYLYSLIYHCDGDFKAVDEAVYVLPELQISTKAEDKLPVTIIKNSSSKESTIITGSTDYGILIVPTDEDVGSVMSELPIRYIVNTARTR